MHYSCTVIIIILTDCTVAEFQCLNGFCADMDRICDGRNDCGDSSDETAPHCVALREYCNNEAMCTYMCQHAML